jgi:hypothetical protein
MTANGITPNHEQSLSVEVGPSAADTILMKRNTFATIFFKTTRAACALGAAPQLKTKN